MKHFKFGETAGFPLDQEVLADMQGSYHEGILAFCESLGSDKPFVLSGCGIVPGGGLLTYEPGLIYNPATQKIHRYNGGSIAVGYGFAYNSVNETLEYEGGAEVGAELYTVSLINPAVDEAATTTLSRKWYHLLDGLMYPALSWVKFDNRVGISELWYCHNKKNKMVTIKGVMTHNNTTSGSNQYTTVRSVAIPTAIKPPPGEEIISTTSLRGNHFINTWAYRDVFDIDGARYDRGSVVLTDDPDGTFLNLICERLNDAYTTTLKHYIYFTYQLT